MQVGERIARDRVARPGKGGCEPANAKAEQGEQAEYGGGSGQEAARKHRVVGCQQGEGDDGSKTTADQSQCAGIARQRRDAGAHQRHGREIACAQQGRGREYQRHQHAIGQSQHDRAGIDDHSAGNGQQTLQRRCQKGNDGDAGGNSCKAARQRGRDDLQCVDTRDVIAGRAEDLEGGDPLPARVEIGCDAASDTDTGNDQCREADKRQELAHAVHEPVGAGCCPIRRVDIEAGVGKLLLQFFADRLGIAALRETNPSLGLIHRSWRDQPGAGG